MKRPNWFISFPFNMAIVALISSSALAQITENAVELPSTKTPVVEIITVTGARTSSAISELPTAVSIIDSASLSQQLGLSTDILKTLDVRVPGLTVASGSRSQCGTNIRGRTPSFQFNGVPANQDLRPSNCNSAFQLSPFAIERVEVVRGATALFGAGAPGGIVNIITRRARSEDVELDFVVQSSANTAEQSGSWQNDVYLGAGRDNGKFDYYLGYGSQDYGAARDPDGQYIPSTEFTSNSWNASLGWNFSDSVRLRFTGTTYRENPGQEYNVNGAEVAEEAEFPEVIAVENNPFRYQGSDGQTTLALSLEADEIFEHALSASIFYQDQEFKQRANFQDFNGGQPDFFSDDRENSTTGIRITLAKELTLAESMLEFEYGVDYQRNRLLRILLNPEDPEELTGFISPEVILDTTGLFLQANYETGPMRYTAGARQELYSGKIGREFTGQGLAGEGQPGDFDDAHLLLFNAGIVVDISAKTQLYGSYNQGAEITQLGRAARNALDPSLISPEPAVSDQYEIGSRRLAGPFEFGAAAFYSKSDAASLVQPDPSCVGQSFCPLIPLRVPQKVWGVEGSVSFAYSTATTIGGVFTWQEGEIFNEELQDFIPFGADTISPTRLTIYSDWAVTPKFSISAQGTYIASTNFYSPSQQGFGPIDTDSVFLMDASAQYALGLGALNIGISNLFNDSYENVTSAAGGFHPTVAEGRRLTLGYQIHF